MTLLILPPSSIPFLIMFLDLLLVSWFQLTSGSYRSLVFTTWSSVSAAFPQTSYLVRSFIHVIFGYLDSSLFIVASLLTHLVVVRISERIIVTALFVSMLWRVTQ